MACDYLGKRMFSIRNVFKNSKQQLDTLEKELKILQEENIETLGAIKATQMEKERLKKNIQIKEFVLKKKNEELRRNKVRLTEAEAEKSQFLETSKIVERKVTDTEYKIKNLNNDFQEAQKGIEEKLQTLGHSFAKELKELQKEYFSKKDEFVKLQSDAEERYLQKKKDLEEKSQKARGIFQKSVEKLEAELEKLNQQLTQQKSEEQELKTELNQLEVDFKRKELSLYKMREKLGRKEELFAAIANDKSELKKQISLLDEEIKHFELNHDDLESSLKAANNEVTLEEKRKDNYLRQKERINLILKKRSAELEKLNLEQEDLVCENLQIRDFLKNQLKKVNQLKANRNNAVIKVEELKQKLQEEEDKTNDILSEIQIEEMKLIQINSSIKQNTECLGRAELEKKQLNQKKQSVLKTISELELEKNRLDNQIKNYIFKLIQKETEIERIQNIEKSDRSIIKELKDNLYSKQAELAESEGEILRLNKKIKNNRDEVNSLKEQLVKIESDIELAQDLYASKLNDFTTIKMPEYLELKNQYRLKENDYTKLKVSKEKLEKDTNETENSINDLNYSIAGFEENITHLNEEMSLLSIKQDEIKQTNINLENKNEELISTLVELRSKKKKLADELHSSENDHEQLNTNNIQLSNLVNELFEEIGARENQLVILERENVKLVASISKARKDYLKAQERKLITNLSFEKLTEENAELNKMLEKYQVAKVPADKQVEVNTDSPTKKLILSEEVECFLVSNSSIKKALKKFEEIYQASSIYVESLIANRKGKDVIIRGNGVFEDRVELETWLDSLIADLKQYNKKKNLEIESTTHSFLDSISFEVTIRRTRKEIISSL